MKFQEEMELLEEARKQFESEDYSGEDLLNLFESYVRESNDYWRSTEDKEDMRIYSIALKSIILRRLNK